MESSNSTFTYTFMYRIIKYTQIRRSSYILSQIHIHIHCVANTVWHAHIHTSQFTHIHRHEHTLCWSSPSTLTLLPTTHCNRCLNLKEASNRKVGLWHLAHVGMIWLYFRMPLYKEFETCVYVCVYSRNSSKGWARHTDSKAKQVQNCCWIELLCCP